jgi:hypothetical protein
MTTLDARVIRVSVEIDGEFQAYESRGFNGFDISARGQKTANPLQNTCEVTISNLNRDTRNYLLTETSPFNSNRRPKRLIVEAGRDSFGTSRLFFGEITSASPSQPPDIGLTLKAQTGAHSKGTVMARSGTARQSLRALAALVAGDLGVSLNFQATDKQIANYSFSGAALRQVDALGAAGGVDVFVDDQTLVVKNRATSLAGRVRILDQATGMIGIPEVTEHGVKVVFLLDQTTVVGGALEIRSQLNPAVNGAYSIYGLDFDIASRREPFYWIADARRPAFNAAGRGAP